jgi:hypothetical protein
MRSIPRISPTWPLLIVLWTPAGAGVASAQTNSFPADPFESSVANGEQPEKPPPLSRKLTSAIALAKKGRIDEARLAATNGTSETPSEDAVEAIVAALPIVTLTSDSHAQSSVTSLAKFLAAWTDVLGGKTSLTYQLARDAKAIGHEDLCQTFLLNSNPFAAQDCREFQKRLREAVADGFARRLILSSHMVYAKYDIPKQKWTIGISGSSTTSSSEYGRRWFRSTPQVCQSIFSPSCRDFCGEHAGPEVGQFEVKKAMPAFEAKNVVEQYRERFDATVAIQHVRSGSRRFPSCQIGGSSFDAHEAFFEVGKIIGVRLRDQTTGEVLLATGVFSGR